MRFSIALPVPFIAVSALALSLVIGCSSKDQTPVSDVPPASHDWSSKMQELSAALNKLLPLVSDSAQFNNPANDAAVNDATNQLKKLSHQVRNLEKPAADPAYDSIARLLDEDLARAVTALHNGNRDYARLTIRESIGYCIQCHTQTANGPSFPKLTLGFDPSKLSPLGQGDFYAATRQFDSALKSYRKGVEDSAFAKKDIFAWERTARSALAIAVRFKESPKESKKIARAITKNKSAPESLRIAANSWLKAIQKWSKEKNPKNESGAAQLAHAEKLVAEADSRVDVENEHGQDILYLRASGALHEWLAANPLKVGVNEADRAKSLYLAGRAAEESRELNFWTLHERYYELCIDTLPNSDLAKSCFKKLNDSVLMGYTGSSGLHLPPDESARLARLKVKANGEKANGEKPSSEKPSGN
ncbi:hypothetical protein BH10BDE1_BH10BDE1_28980 [soil metagenome]